MIIDKRDPVIILCFILFILALLFEGFILYQAYINADSVECTFLWCTFTTTKGSADIQTSITCSQNGQPVNCSDLTMFTEEEIKRWLP